MKASEIGDNCEIVSEVVATVWKTNLNCLLRFATAMFGRHQLKVEVYWKAKVQSGSGLENQLKDFDLNAALCEVLKTPTKTGSSCRLNTV